jgi:hypothetical protein
MTKTALLSVLSSLAFVAFLGACLFAAAGRWDLPWYWGFLGVWAVAMVAGLLLIDPTLVQERLRPGPAARITGPLSWNASGMNRDLTRFERSSGLVSSSLKINRKVVGFLQSFLQSGLQHNQEDPPEVEILAGLMMSGRL